jgi:hypothetical protein
MILRAYFLQIGNLIFLAGSAHPGDCLLIAAMVGKAWPLLTYFSA